MVKFCEKCQGHDARGVSLMSKINSAYCVENCVPKTAEVQRQCRDTKLLNLSQVHARQVLQTELAVNPAVVLKAGRLYKQHLCICAWLGGLSFCHSCLAAQGHVHSSAIVWQQRMLPCTLPLDLHTSGVDGPLTGLSGTLERAAVTPHPQNTASSDCHSHSSSQRAEHGLAPTRSRYQRHPYC